MDRRRPVRPRTPQVRPRAPPVRPPARRRARPLLDAPRHHPASHVPHRRSDRRPPCRAMTDGEPTSMPCSRRASGSTRTPGTTWTGPRGCAAADAAKARDPDRDRRPGARRSRPPRRDAGLGRPRRPHRHLPVHSRGAAPTNTRSGCGASATASSSPTRGRRTRTSSARGSRRSTGNRSTTSWPSSSRWRRATIHRTCSRTGRSTSASASCWPGSASSSARVRRRSRVVEPRRAQRRDVRSSRSRPTTTSPGIGGVPDAAAGRDAAVAARPWRPPLWWSYLPDSRTLYVQYNEVSAGIDALAGEILARVARLATSTASSSTCATTAAATTRRTGTLLEVAPGSGDRPAGTAVRADRAAHVLGGGAISRPKSRANDGRHVRRRGDGRQPEPVRRRRSRPTCRTAARRSTSRSRYWQMSTADDPRLTIEPDIAVALSSADYLAGRDPVWRP